MNPAGLANHVVALTQIIDTFAHTVQTLQLENQTLRDLVAQNSNVLCVAPEPKVNPPVPLTGDRKTYREFINACKLMS